MIPALCICFFACTYTLLGSVNSYGIGSAYITAINFNRSPRDTFPVINKELAARRYGNTVFLKCYRHAEYSASVQVKCSKHHIVCT